MGWMWAEKLTGFGQVTAPDVLRYLLYRVTRCNPNRMKRETRYWFFNFSVAGFLVNINFRACDNCQIANFTKQKLQNAMSVLKSLPDQKIKRCLSRWKLFGKQLPLSAFRRERWKAAAWTSSSGRGNICRHLLLQSKFLSLQYSWQNVTRRLPWMGGRVSET